MPESGFNILKRKISAIIDDGRQDFYDEINRETVKFASRGFSVPIGNPGVKIVELLVRQIRDISINSLKVISDLADKKVLDVNSQSKHRIIAIVMNEVSNEAGKLKLYADKQYAKAPIQGKMANLIFEATTKVKKEIELELDILINSNKPKEINSVFNVYNYGTANAIQAGHNNYINQNITEKTDKLVASILDILQQIKLQDAKTLPHGLKESIEEALVELQSPGDEKNMFKVQSCLLMTMTTLQTLPALKPAVAVLVTAYDYYFGTNASQMFK